VPVLVSVCLSLSLGFSLSLLSALHELCDDYKLYGTQFNHLNMRAAQMTYPLFK
jgi:hypothetical protein